MVSAVFHSPLEAVADEAETVMVVAHNPGVPIAMLELMLEAAAQGLGVAVMHASHFKEAADSRLVRLFPETRVESPYRYYFVCRPRALQTRAVRIFRDWLIAADI